MKQSGLKNKNLYIKTTVLAAFCLALCGQSSGQKGQVVATLYDDGAHTCNIHILYNQVRKKTNGQVIYYWYRNGHIQSNTGNYSGSLLHGDFEKFSYSGSLREKGSFRFGTKDGGWQYWDNGGKIQKEEHWKEGFLKYRRTRQNDTLVISEFFRDNSLHKKIAAIPGDSVISKQKYRNGKPVTNRRFYPLKAVKGVFSNKKKETINDEPGSAPKEKKAKSRGKKKDKKEKNVPATSDVTDKISG